MIAADNGRKTKTSIAVVAEDPDSDAAIDLILWISMAVVEVCAKISAANDLAVTRSMAVVYRKDKKAADI